MRGLSGGQPRGTYIFIVRREALKPREGAGGGPSPLTMLRNQRHSQMNKPIKPRTTKSIHSRAKIEISILVNMALLL